ncbi:hypothetical protein HAV15_006492 [Penicillium sp. str. |nr:hypothetical protein HAV15_006492 [Penicillium sp. str. \
MKPVAALFVVSLASAAYGWKVGDSSTGSTDPDVTTKCTQWANDISSKDSCKALQKEFDIDFQQLHEWNPSLLKDPCVPIEGWSYCVGSSSKSNDQASGWVLRHPHPSFYFYGVHCDFDGGDFFAEPVNRVCWHCHW